jgi:hypothetical protein
LSAFSKIAPALGASSRELARRIGSPFLNTSDAKAETEIIVPVAQPRTVMSSVDKFIQCFSVKILHVPALMRVSTNKVIDT